MAVNVDYSALLICKLTIVMQSDSSSQEFYSRTLAALDKKEQSDAEVVRKLHEVKDDALAHKPQPPIGGGAGQKPLVDDSDRDKSHVEIEVPQKLPTDKVSQMKAPSDNRPPEDRLDSEKSVAGRKTMQKGDTKKPQAEKDPSPGISKEKAVETDGEKKESKEDTQETEEAHEVEQEINSILKRSPSTSSHSLSVPVLMPSHSTVIIFSKSYCPHSKRAKGIFDKYSIVPAPFIVELDQHPLGPKMQDTLEKMTGRRTVPNVLINGKSIGGGDDVAALDTGTDFIDKVKDMGGKRIMEAKKKDASA